MLAGMVEYKYGLFVIVGIETDSKCVKPEHITSGRRIYHGPVS